MPWLTGNSPLASAGICRRLLIPDDRDLLMAVNGALLELTKPENWEQFGNMEPEEAAKLMLEMWYSFVNSDCEEESSGGETVYIGEVKWFALDVLPDNVLPCAGGTFYAVDYPELFSVLPAAYIVDAETFTLPNLEEKAIFGAGIAQVGEEAGANFPFIQVQHLPDFEVNLPGSLVIDGSQGIGTGSGKIRANRNGSAPIRSYEYPIQVSWDNRPNVHYLRPGIVAR